MLKSPNPALVTQREAQRLPRLALILFCAAYVLPGVFGRDPWRNADVTAFGYMFNIAQGRTAWLEPTVGGLPPESALLPYWIGAVFIQALDPFMDAAFAARVPFALLLVLALALVWYATYSFALSENAQPLPLAFGGEARPVDYARAVADGAVLANIAALGLLQLGHETTPELVQLAGVSLLLYGLAAVANRPTRARIAVMLSLPVLAASGAPTIALGLGLLAVVLCMRAEAPALRQVAGWVAASTALAVLVATAIGAWGWRLGRYDAPAQALGLVRQLVWFTWPAWPLMLWTLWRWRARLSNPHIALPLACLVVSLAAWISMGGSDRALMLGLPPLAVLAAFALPTLQRSTAAAIDWFSVFFFSFAALTIWVIYVSMQTGVPAKPAANIARLAPGYPPSFSSIALLCAVLATLAWLFLVHWRTRRARHPLWKSMVLPASGVTLCWLLVMTLLLPPLDHARSYRSLVNGIAQQVPRGGCVAAPGLSKAQVVALEYFGSYRVDAVTPAARSACEFLLLPDTRPRIDAGAGPWEFIGRVRRGRSDDEVLAIYRRIRRAG